MSVATKPIPADPKSLDFDGIYDNAKDILLHQCGVPRELLKFGTHKMRMVDKDIYSAVSGWFTPQGCMCKTQADFLTVDGCTIVPPGDPTENVPSVQHTQAIDSGCNVFPD